MIALPAILAGLISGSVRAAAVRGVAAAGRATMSGMGRQMVSARSMRDPVRTARIRAAYRLRSKAKSTAERKAIARAYNVLRGGGVSVVQQRDDQRFRDTGRRLNSGFMMNQAGAAAAAKAVDEIDRMTESTLKLSKGLEVMGRAGTGAMGSLVPMTGLVTMLQRMNETQMALSRSGSLYSSAQARAAALETMSGRMADARTAAATGETAEERAEANARANKAKQKYDTAMGNLQNRVLAGWAGIKTKAYDFAAGSLEGPQLGWNDLILPGSSGAINFFKGVRNAFGANGAEAERRAETPAPGIPETVPILSGLQVGAAGAPPGMAPAPSPGGRAPIGSFGSMMPPYNPGQGKLNRTRQGRAGKVN